VTLQRLVTRSHRAGLEDSVDHPHLAPARPRKTRAARFRRTMSSSERRPTRLSNHPPGEPRLAWACLRNQTRPPPSTLRRASLRIPVRDRIHEILILTLVCVAGDNKGLPVCLTHERTRADIRHPNLDRPQSSSAQARPVARTFSRDVSRLVVGMISCVWVTCYIASSLGAGRRSHFGAPLTMRCT
jgi:hypothetical protein